MPVNMQSLYLLGARQRTLFFKDRDEPYLYENALVLNLDTNTGQVTTCVEYKSPAEARASEFSSNIFKSGTLVGNKLYACTSTEVMIFEVPTFRRLSYVSLPIFNDVHHVTPSQDGHLLAASTGLDLVVKFTHSGEILREWSVLGEDPWATFSRSIDYRKVDSTKPHKSHPNFVFEMDGEVWVTRFMQRDAICLTKPENKIEIGVQSPHDGLIVDDRIYFTTVDGRIIIVNRHTRQVDEIVDLKQMNGSATTLLGWCRGLLTADHRYVWIGFTRVRKTKFKENILWVKNMFRDGVASKPTHIALYDIVRKECLQEFNLEDHGMNIIFSIFPVRGVPAELPTAAVADTVAT